ncbi:MAG TPA: molybdate ABC transporter substrate-binding protein, partial [Arenicellales bacterium]|nr:molybdate ABC transporter substrate-binding protein [Arenicellales bacterium]
AETIRVATASNFTTTLARIAERFRQGSGHQVVLVPGSTGKHYAQIRNGAPFDAFFAADVRRPALLEDEDAIVPGSRFTYAVGRLALWSPETGMVDPEGAVLESDRFRHLALANPRLAPYGRAARELLRALGLWDALEDRLVYGENIGQTFHFVESGAAQLGLVAYSQVLHAHGRDEGSYWLPPRSLYSPIEQQAVALTSGQATLDFLEFTRSAVAAGIIRDFGYELP